MGDEHVWHVYAGAGAGVGAAAAAVDDASVDGRGADCAAAAAEEEGDDDTISSSFPFDLGPNFFFKRRSNDGGIDILR